jgi:hypothetical protein
MNVAEKMKVGRWHPPRGTPAEPLRGEQMCELPDHEMRRGRFRAPHLHPTARQGRHRPTIWLRQIKKSGSPAPLRLCAFAPLRLCAFAPLRLCAFAPLRVYSAVDLSRQYQNRLSDSFGFVICADFDRSKGSFA